MEFISTRLKNILSFGGDEVFEIKYEKSSFNLVWGDNGVGKTNFTKLIEIGLYFEYPETVADIRNNNSKEGFIEHTIFSNGHTWEIKSTFNKSLKSIEVKKDGKVEDWGNPSSVQAKLKQHVIDIPFTVFKNILCSSMDNMSSILKMNAKESRDITNQIFDLSEINKISEFVNKDHYSINQDLSKKEQEKKTLEESLESKKETLNKFVEEQKEDNKQELKTLNEELSEKEKEKTKKDEEITSSKTNIESIENSIKRKKYDENITELNNNIEEKKKFDNKDLEVELESINSSIVVKKAMELVKSISDSEEELKTLESNNESEKEKITNSNNELERLKSEKEKIEYFNSYREKLVIASDKAKKLKSEIIPSINKKIGEKDAISLVIKGKNDSILKLKGDNAELEPEIKFLKEPICLACGADFSDEKHAKRLEEIEKQLEENKKNITKLGDEVKLEEGKLKTLESEINKLNEDKSTLMSEVKSFDKENDYNYEISFNNGVNFTDFDEKCKPKNHSDYLKIVEDYSKEEANNKVLVENEKTTSNSIISKKSKIKTEKESYKKEYSIEYEDFDSYEALIKDFKEPDLERKTEIETKIKTNNESISEIDKKIGGFEQVKKDLDSYKDFEIIKSDDLEKDLENENSNLKTKEGELKLIEDSISEKNTLIKKIEEDDIEKKTKTFREEIEKTELDIKNVKTAYLEKLDDSNSMELLKELYVNGWLKNELIGQVVGGINSVIAEISRKYEIPVSCKFDSSFNAILYKDGVETKYGLCSLGQRKMMQLISIVGIVSYYKQIYPKVNFIFLDEALSSLTEVNVNKMIVILKEYLIGRLEMTIFISHHSHLKSDNFDNKFELYDRNGSTIIKITK